jgi:microcompartment protein CcmL/EutN
LPFGLSPSEIASAPPSAAEGVPPALGVLELSSIARGVFCADAMVKKAPVKILRARTVSPGKYVVVLGGGVAEVDESLQAGVAAAGPALVDKLFLPQVHPSVWPAMQGQTPAGPGLDALAVIETATVASTVLAADAAAKAAEVTLLVMRLAIGLGGKGFFTLTGTLDNVEAAVLAGQSLLDPSLLVGVEIIPRPHDDLVTKLHWGS